MSLTGKWMAGLSLVAVVGWGPVEGMAPDRTARSRGQGLVEAPPVLNAGLFQRGTGAHAWRTGLSAERLQTAAAELEPSGLRLVDLNVRARGDGTVTYDGAWRPGQGAYALHVGMSWEELVERWQTLGAQGLRLWDLEIYVEAGIHHYAGLWRAGSQGHALYVGLTWEQLVERQQWLATKGQRLVDLETFLMNGVRGYAGVWRAGAGAEQLWKGASQADFDAQVREMAAAGLQPVDVRVYWEDDGWRYVAVFREGLGEAEVVSGQEDEGFQATWRDAAARGLRLSRSQTYSAPAWEEAFRQTLEGRAVGYAYAIVEGGRITRSGGVGHARAPDEKTAPGVAMTDTTRVHLASVSKPITATALMRVVEQWGLSLDASFHAFVRHRWPIAAPGVETVTLRHLLTHQSGMAPWGYCGEDFDESMRQLIASPLEHPPGEGPSYSNGNFCLLRAVIEAVTQTDYVTYVKTSVLEPMGITDMSCTPDATAGTLYYAQGASTEGYFWAEDYASQCGAYGWYASATDLARFLIGLRHHTVLSRATTETMLSGALGWWPTSTLGGPASHHNGVWLTGDGRGCNTGMVRLPNGVDAVLLSNTHGVDPIGLLLDSYNAGPYAL